jgi:hypothetical protein
MPISIPDQAAHGDGAHRSSAARAASGLEVQWAMLGDMTLQRMDNVGIVVDDLAAAIAFFGELGLELEGEAAVEGRWVDRVVGLDGSKSTSQ